MIFGRFEDIDLFGGFGGRLQQAIDFVSGLTTDSKNGKYELDSDRVFAEINSYQSRSVEDALFESHRKYIDIQVVLNGCEYIGVYRGQQPEIVELYSPEKDVQFYKHPNKYSQILMEPGSFLILFPEDYHYPGCYVESPEQVKKLVVKVAVE